jgi:hypothetical protein
MNTSFNTTAVVEFLNAVIDANKARADQEGYVRISMGLLKDPKSSSRELVDGPAAQPLLSHFRAVAGRLDPTFKDPYIPSDVIIAFVCKALDGLHLQPSDVRYREFPARTEPIMGVDLTTGEEIVVGTKPIPKARVPYLGVWGRPLSEAAKATNAFLDTFYAKAFGGSADAPETQTPITDADIPS